MIPQRRTKPKPAPVLATTNTVDQDDTIIKLAKYLDGSAWTINYYSQTVTTDDTIQTLDTNMPTSEQHYARLNDLIVTTPTPMTTTSLDNITGTIMYNQLIYPQVGDIFTAPLMTGDIGVFTITTVTPMNFALDTVYQLEFKLDTTNLLDQERYNALLSAVTVEYFYSQTSLYTEGKQLLISQDKDYMVKLRKLRNGLVDTYLYDFTKDIILTLDNSKYQAPWLANLFTRLTPPKSLLNYHSCYDYSTQWVEQFLKETTLHKGYYNIVPRSSLAPTNKLRDYVSYDIDYVILIDREIKTLKIPLMNNPKLPVVTLNNPIAIWDTQDPSVFSHLLRLMLAGDELPTNMAIDLINTDFTLTERYYYYPFFILLVDYTIVNLKGR